MKKIVSLFVWLLLVTSLSATEITKNTFVYDIKGSDTLRLDKYEIADGKTNKPCVMFMFGGGFVGGKRDKVEFRKYFDRMANLGYTVVSIDYRLGLKNTSEDIKNGKEVGPQEMVGRLNNAINIAVEDLYDATNFILKNAIEWNIDPKNIIISGSSAGAISVLQAEYYLHSNRSKLPQMLPNGFDYSGVISFAGAIFSMQGDPGWTSKPAPILFFHGDADKNVPFDKISMFTIGFYGSKFLTSQLDLLKTPYEFFDFNNANHAIASIPMTEYLPEIESFISRWVIDKKQLVEINHITDMTIPDVDKNFTLEDFITSNFQVK